VRWGYFMAAISKPLMAIYTYPLWIFGARTLDRMGKGVRTGARDAMLSNETDAANKGSVFGFHRSMDTLGACIGPAITLLLIGVYHNSYQQLFLFALIPGILSTLLLFIIKEKYQAPKAQGLKQSKGIFTFFAYWQLSDKTYKKVAIGLLVFTLFNSSDYFLLLRMKTSGLSDTAVIGVYIFYNLVYALLSYPLGRLGDKYGLKNVLTWGFILFAIVYGGMAFAHSLNSYLFLFFIYGAYAASADGIATALLSNLCNKTQTGSAIGSFKAMQSICTMLASCIAGFMVLQLGYSALFIMAALVAVVVFVYFLLMGRLSYSTGKS